MLTMARNIDRKSTRLNSSHTVIYTLSLHDALPILTEIVLQLLAVELAFPPRYHQGGHAVADHVDHGAEHRSEEHTSELQSHSDLHSFPTRRSSDLNRDCAAAARGRARLPTALPPRWPRRCRSC